MCLTLLTPTMEKVVDGFGFLSDIDFSVAELIENEEENKESEKEEKKEKELEEFDFLDYRYSVFLTQGLSFLQNLNFYKSHVDDVPSPPPDYSY
jgi:hypothetical protein